MIKKFAAMILTCACMLCGCSISAVCRTERTAPSESGTLPENRTPSESEVPSEAPAEISAIPAEEIIYGTSGSGDYPLKAYRMGDGENVLLMTFAVHGWDDGYPGDGELFVRMGQALTEYLTQNPPEGWSVYVIPCVNPDGVYNGFSSNGPGRCTTHRTENGERVSGDGRGIDINRSFPYNFTPMSDKRNYNGREPLMCAEASALAEFAESVMGTGSNAVIDVHGWDGALYLSDPGGSILLEPLGAAFPESTARFREDGTVYSQANSLENGSGYFSAWCGYVLGFDAALLELSPASLIDPYSSEARQEEALFKRLCRAVSLILK